MQASILEYATDEHRWEALVKKDPQADGVFFYGVKTTGIYCRPTCTSRLPNRKNVTFFQTYREAENEGFRPCKRCQPNTISPHQQQIELISHICQLIETSELSLEEMAKLSGLSKYHFHRLFKQIVGVTPKDYAIAHRIKRVCQQLQDNTSVTQAIYNAGFENSSSFYDKSTMFLGMIPSQYQKGGVSEIDIWFVVKEVWLGWIIVAATKRGICAIHIGDNAEALIRQLQAQFPNAQIERSDPIFQNWVEQIIAYIETPQKGLNLPLDIQGTAFQQRVWKALQDIPIGNTASYTEIAQQIGNPKAVRAVARACATNQIAVAIPCHRVIGSDGSLKGYRWGNERKQALLEHEANAMLSLSSEEQ